MINDNDDAIARYLNYIPQIIIVEPDSAACILASIKTGKIEKISIDKESIMGGMSCGEVSLVPWEILKNSVHYCVTVSDDFVSKTVKYLANNQFSDEKIIAGECSTPGIASLVGLSNNNEIRKTINGVVIIINEAFMGLVRLSPSKKHNILITTPNIAQIKRYAKSCVSSFSLMKR